MRSIHHKNTQVSSLHTEQRFERIPKDNVENEGWRMMLSLFALRFEETGNYSRKREIKNEKHFAYQHQCGNIANKCKEID